MASYNNQIPNIYAQAIATYKEITKSDLDVAILSRLRNVDDLTREVDARNQKFNEFREKRHIIFQSLSIALKPIELVGNLAAGSASMAFPPSSLVFGAVSYLIDAAKGVSASYNAIQDLMETLKDFTIRLKVYSREQISSELSSKLSGILVTLIEIFALSTKAIKGGRLLKFTRNVLLGSDDEIQSSISKLDKLTKTEASLVGAETLVESKRTGRMVDGMSVTVTSTNVTVQETGQVVGQMSLEVTDVRETLGDVLLKVNQLSELKEEARNDQEKTHQDIVKKALQPSKTNAPQDWYDKINKSRVPNTGDWIRREEVFKSWVGKDVPIIFISGNPGAGKSFLSSNIITFLREQHPQGVQHPSHVSVGYFFFKDDNPSTRSFHQAFRDIAYQISQNDPVYQKYLSSTVEDYESISTMESAWRTLFVDYFLIDKYGDSSVYMLFDGVDEAFETERQIFLSLLKDVRDAGHDARIQLAVVGRPQLSDQIVEGLELESERGIPTIHVSSLKNSGDIERYIKSSIHKSVILRRVSSKLSEEIVEKLSSGAQGMFIWVDLMLKELLKKRNESSMRKSLNQAPNGLKEMLRHVLESFSASSNEEELEYLNELLAWTACALRPFKLGEIETILRLKSPEGEGMIYPEGMLRKQFASFFTLNREDGLTTAELQNPHRYKDDSDDEEEEGEKREVFEDVENETDFDSNKETTEVTFCHASIGDFLRDETQGKVSAGDGHIPIGVDYHDGKVHILMTCLKLLCDPEFVKKFEGTADFTRNYVCEYWPVHLRSIELSRVKLEDRKEIASMLAKMFSQEGFMELWTDSKAWHCSNESLKLVRQWWEDKEVVDSLHQEERDFVTLTSSSPATTFKPVAMIYAKKWLDQQKAPMKCVAAIVSYKEFEKDPNLNSTSINLKPTAKETIDAAEWSGKEKTAIWYRRVAMVLRICGHYEEALEYFLKSDQMDPNECLTKTGLAKLYVLQKQWRKAIELDQKTEQVLLKRIGEEPDKASQHRDLAHQLQERMGDSYGQLKDKDNRFATFKRAFVNQPNCDRCINVIIFHNNDEHLYKDTIDMLKKLQSEEVTGKEYSRLTASLWENPSGGTSYFYDCADAARKTNELDFLVEAYREAIRAAKKEAKNITASWLELSLAKLYKEYVGDEKKAVRTWERIIDTYAASKDEDEIGEVKQVASEFLAKHIISEAVDAGIGSAEAEKQGKRLEELVRKKTTFAKEAISWIPANLPALILGLWYRLSGRQEEADACFRPSIKEAIQILSDDDPENDVEGLFELQNALLVAGDESNVLAIAYYLGVYEDDEPGTVNAKEEDESEGHTSDTESEDLNDDANGASEETETDDEQDKDGMFNYRFGVPDEDLRMTCDGPCRLESMVEDKFYVCRYCLDVSFCEDCVKLLEEAKLPIHICDPKHAKDFFFIPPRPQKVEKGKVLVDGKIVGFEEWRDDLKKQWRIRKAWVFWSAVEPSMATDVDFVLTISDHEGDVLSNLDDSEIVPAPPKANIGKKRKRGLDSRLESKKSSKKTKNARPSSETGIGREARLDQDERASGSEEVGQPDEAIDPNFEFDLGPNYQANTTEDFDGWELKARASNNAENGKKGVKKAVDIDEIIARRASNKQKSNNKAINDTSSMSSVDDLQGEQALDEGGYEDDDKQEGGAGFLDFGDDELLATDGFGAGAASENGEDEDATDGEGSEVEILPPMPELAQSNSEVEDSDADSVASPTAHPDDLESDDEDTASMASGENEEEAAKRAAFFAPEDAIPQPKNMHTIPSESNSFQQFSLSRPLLRGIAAVNFLSPTPIQKRTIPIALAGKDVVGSAVTGSGKTAAFLLPILERLLYRPKKVPTTRVAILLPTRELAVQCHNVAMSLAQFTDITFVQLVGGFSVREQEALLKRRPDVVIATPGRFIDHMRNSASFAVEGLEILVLDEADRMLEDGFADELDEILRTIPKGRQTMLFSATMTESVDKLVRVGMNRPVRVSVDAQKATVEGLVQEFVRLRPGREDKRMASLLLLCTKVYNERVIVFFRQKKEVHRARIIFGLLGLKSGELHGGMSQEQRINAVASFRSGKTTHLLATDLASRGLDIKNVLTVINYEAPQSHEIYLHRVGRTARAGKSGRACTIAAEPDRKVVKAAVKSARGQGAKIMSRTLELNEVDDMDTKLRSLEDDIAEVLREEQEEKQLAQADMQLTRGENLVKHEKEILARPKRTWFESEKEKRVSKKAGRAELNGPESVLGKKQKQKLSGKDKKRLDDRRERIEGKTWKKGKESEAVAKAERRESKARKGSKGISPTKRPKSRRPQKH